MQFKGRWQDYNLKGEDRFMMIDDDEGKVMSYIRQIKVCILKVY
jgi:hypothetical protein